MCPSVFNITCRMTKNKDNTITGISVYFSSTLWVVTAVRTELYFIHQLVL